MKAIRFAFGSLLFLTFFATTSIAQVQRTFVSGLGSDGNPCSRTAPCRTFAQALMGTSAGGDVVVLDSAGYGPATIKQSVSIIAPPGVYAGVTVFSGDGIDVSAGLVDTVVLSGLIISDQGSMGSGIIFRSGAKLHVERCVISGFNNSGGGAGILSISAGNLEVKDSIIRGNASAIDVATESGAAVATFDAVRIEGNVGGLQAFAGSKVTVRNSVAAGNISFGFLANSDSSLPAELSIEGCLVSNNANNGIWASSGSTGVATVRVSNSTVTDNGIGLHNNGSPAVILSRGNNTIEGNGTDTVGTIGSYAAK